MRMRSIETLGSRVRGGATGQLVPDLVESCARVVGKTRLPSREGALSFLGSQLWANAAAWTAGVMAARVVETFFEARGIRNLWGLAAWGDRTLVSADHYRLIMNLTSYTAGLVMLIGMRHLVLRWVTEFRDLRLERSERDRACDLP